MNGRIGLPYIEPDGFPMPNAQLRDLTIARGWCIVVASVYYIDDERPHEATVVLLYREPPFFGVAEYELETDTIKNVTRHENIVYAIREYEQRGGDV